MDFAGAFSWINIRFMLGGFWITIQVAAISIVLSILIGFALAIVRYWEIPVLSRVVGLIIDTIRNLPLLLIIFFTYFALPQIGIQFNVFWSTVAAMTTFESAMISEILRGGLKAIPKGQTEAALSTGLSTTEIMFRVLLPQAVLDTVPSVVSQLIALIKDTSLATVITLPELAHRSRIIYSQNTAQVIPVFILMAAMYFILCYALSRVSEHMRRSVVLN